MPQLAEICRRWTARAHPLASSLRALSRSQSPAAAAGLLARLRARIDDVSRIAPAAEEDFLELGRLIRSLSSAGGRLGQRTGLLLQTSLGQDGGSEDLKKVAGLLRSALESEASSRRLTSGLLVDLAQSVTLLGNLGSISHSFHDTLAVLGIVEILFRTESARLPADVRGLFLNLGEQILELEGQVKATFAEKFQAVAATRRTLAAARAEIESQARAREARAVAAESTIRNALDSMLGQIDQNRSREVELIRMSRVLSDNAASVVVGLQAHDIVTQRLQHLVEGLDKALSGHDPGSLPSQSTLARLAEFCALAAGQTGAAATDLEQALAAVRHGASEIAGQVSSGDEESALYLGFNQSTGTVADMVQVLLEALEEVRHVVASAESGSAGARAAVAPIAGATSHLNQAVEEVSLRIRMVALNAEIVAVQRGAGTGLEVLAARAAHISAETESLGARVAESSDEISRRVGSAARGFTEIEQAAGAWALRLNSEGACHEETLHSLRNRMLDQLQDLGAIIDEMRDAASAISSRAAAIDPALDALRLAQSDLASLANDIAALLPPGLVHAPSADPNDHWLASGHSMHSERVVHRSVLGGTAGDPPVSAVEPGDIELF